MAEVSVLGRKKSTVWKHFDYWKESDTSVCTVHMPTTEDPNKMCGKTLKGNFPTNLKKHLKKIHPALLKEVEEAEKVSKKNRKDTSSGKQSKAQLTLETSLEHHNRYTESSIQYKAITKNWPFLYVGSTNVALSLVENQEFRDLLLTLDKRYQVPSRKKISKEIDAVCVRMKTNIQSLPDKARKISLCVDIWSKPGMTASFLDVTSHFFVENKSHTICLAARRFPSPHTGQRIAEFLYNIVTEWNIDLIKIFRILTDNGSNVVRACQILEDLMEEHDHLEKDGKTLEDNNSEKVITEIEEDSQILIERDTGDRLGSISS